MFGLQGLGGLTSEENPPPKKEPLPFLRITVVGASGCGKTSLISSWVNNYFPSAHIPTHECQLFYRTLRVLHPLDESKLLTLFVEIEDTPPFQGPDGIENIKKFLDSSTPSGSKTHDSEPFANCSRQLYSKGTAFSKSRMGLFVLFDPTKEQTLFDAQKVIECRKPKGGEGEHQQTFLVAAKSDKEPTVHTKEILKRARLYAIEHKIGFEIVSALDYSRVQKLFRDALISICQEPTYCTLHCEETNVSDQHENGGFFSALPALPIPVPECPQQ